MRCPRVLALLVIPAALSGCAGSPAPTANPPDDTLHVTSPDWRSDTALVAPYACTHDGDHGSSPALSWNAGPPGTRYYAVTVVDRDAGGFVHWAALNLPAGTRSLAAGDDGGATELTNGYGYPGYGAPCPPPGSPHRYILTVWALGDRASTLASLPGEELASGEITATFGR